MDTKTILEYVTLILATLGVAGVPAGVVYASLRKRIKAFALRGRARVAVIADASQITAAQQLCADLKSDGIPHTSVTSSPHGAAGAHVVVVLRPESDSAAELIQGALDVAPTAYHLVLYPGRLELAREVFARIHLCNSDLRLWGDLQAATSRVGAQA